MIRTCASTALLALLLPGSVVAQPRPPAEFPNLLRRALGEPTNVSPELDADGCPRDVPAHVVLMIGDGMGDAQIEAGGHFVHGRAGSLAMEGFAHRGTMSVPALDADEVDSAASATAMSTGRMVNNGVVAVALPGDGRDLETVAELFGRCGREVGLVTTSTMGHATPAAFGAHIDDRNRYGGIVSDYLAAENIGFILGGQTDPITSEVASANGWTAVTSAQGLDEASDADRVLGFFIDGHLPYRAEEPEFEPQLVDLTTWALERTTAAGTSFLLIEGARIDHAGHDNLDAELVGEMSGFDEAVRAVEAWAAERDDVLVLVTADHETGGLELVAGRGAGHVPEMTWEHGHHTAQDVSWFAMGVGAERIPRHIRHTDVYRVLLGAF